MANSNDSESEIMTAITAFEQILEAMPNDRASLEALSHAYEQIGDITRAKDFLVRLGEVMLEEGDAKSAQTLLNRLSPYIDEDPRAKDISVKIVNYAEAFDAAAPARSAAAQAVASDFEKKAEVVSSFNMADELSFAWNLMEASQLTQEEYSQVVQNLTEMSSSDGLGTISVLHVLDAMGFKGIEKVLAYISTEGHAPIISLSSFDMHLSAVKILPLPFMKARGVISFELLAGDALVVVMNPFDKQLLKDTETLAKRRCHFYTCLPVEFDKAIEKAAEIIAADAEHAAAQR